MTSQSLAVIGQIVAAQAIPGADMIHQVTAHCGSAGTWQGVASKDIDSGAQVLVLLQDALLPQDQRWQFMERHNWRVRMARFKGVPSECVILPLEQFGLDGAPGTSVANQLGVTKYEKPIPAHMGGDAVGAFPSFIPRTDEPNFQTVPELVARMAIDPWYAAEKADGTSCTAWVDVTGALHVCSRNWELREFTATGAQNVYWRAARKYGLERLPHGVALQFEVVGPGIQGNPMGLKDLEARAFSHDELRELASIRYSNDAHAEGVVIRALDSSWSFKVINLAYKG